LKIFIRAADINDTDLLFKWFNDKDTFKFKIKTKNRVTILEHKKWFSERLKDKNTFIWIIENKKKESLGQIRFQHSTDNYYDVDIFVVDKARKLGLASKALIKVEKISNIKPLRAVVKKNNYLSYLFFTRNSYSLLSEDTEFWTLVKL
jgi:hypothetical protein